MLSCTQCKTDWVYKVHLVQGFELCDKCYRKPPDRNGAILGQKVVLDNGTNRMVIPRSEYDEIHRNVLLPGSTDEKRYMGRRMENGRIAERPISPY